jgi:hypothetical protein
VRLPDDVLPEDDLLAGVSGFANGKIVSKIEVTEDPIDDETCRSSALLALLGLLS